MSNTRMDLARLTSLSRRWKKGLDAAQYKSSMLVLAVSKNGPGAGQINKNLLERFSLTTFAAQGEKAWQKKSLLAMLLIERDVSQNLVWTHL